MSTNEAKQVTKKTRRALATEKPAGFPAELAEHAIKFYEQNKAANEAGRNAKTARAALFTGMKDAHLKRGELSYFPIGGAPVTLIAEITTPTVNVVDITKLAALVPMDALLRIVSATQEAVKSVAGEAVLRQCLVPTAGTENVSVKPAK